MVSETIGNLFLPLQKNIKKVRHCTSEPSEHTFGNMRMDNREFSIGDFCLLAEKEARRMKTMFDGDLSPSKTANKGYSATFLDWVADVKENQEEGGPCIIDTSNDDFTVIEQIWPLAQKIISESVKLMTPLLKLFGVDTKAMSPFCREFSSQEELMHAYIAYCPKTFSYNGRDGMVNDQGKDEECAHEIEDGDTNQISSVLHRFEKFTQDILTASACPSQNDDKCIEMETVTFDERRTDTSLSMQKMRKMKTNTALLSSFTKLSNCTRIEDLFDDILQVSASIESMDDKSERGSLSQRRKTKTLFGRWTSRTVQALTLETTPIEVGEGEDIIGRNTIVTCKFKNGRKRDSPTITITKDYRVLTVYDKFYNKWYMSTEKKKWSPIMDGQLKSKYRFAVRMVEDGTLEAFEDVRLTDDTYDLHHVIKMVTGKDIIGVKGVAHLSMLDDGMSKNVEY